MEKIKEMLDRLIFRTGEALTKAIKNGAVGAGTETLAQNVGMLNEMIRTRYFITHESAPEDGKGFRASLTAEERNSLYRGKCLGEGVTPEQWDAIKNGTFDGMFIGDYWEINGITWRIAGFNYWESEKRSHIVIVPDENLCRSPLNSKDTTEGGYADCEFRMGEDEDSAINTAYKKAAKAFGEDHIMEHKELLDDGEIHYCLMELMSEQMVFGEKIYADEETEADQLPLFAINGSKIANGSTWWLRDVVSAARFARVNNAGNATTNDAGYAGGIRPAFAIYQS